ncbi:unnamed protein product [Mytilus edulis]|uniref:Uncharacterized protein n=1 Tax=Mytilus edulis TaxID=6550 RepID=A0A8S3S7H3_MYTED|nr:unnamed protein product [Mytilus edulis]
MKTRATTTTASPTINMPAGGTPVNSNRNLASTSTNTTSSSILPPSGPPPAPPLPSTTTSTSTVIQQTPQPTTVMSAVSQIPSSTPVSQFNTNHQNKPHIHPIKPFDGNSSVVQWFKSFMIYMNIMNCTEQTIVQSFSHFLTGKAEQWFLTLNEQVVTLNRLQELLYTRFKPTPLTVEMLQVEQGNSESVDDYIHRVMKMCADANLQEIQLMTKAMRGLKATIARIVMPQSPINIEDLRVKANLAETTLRVTSKEQDSDFHASVSYITEHLDSKLEQIRLENDAVIAAGFAPIHRHLTIDRHRDNDCAEVGFTTPLQQNTIDVIIDKRKTHGLIDTGASISIINKELLDKTGYAQNRLKPPTYLKIKGVSGQKLNVLGKIEIDIMIDGKIFKYPLNVVENVHHSLILGFDFINHFNGKIDCGNKTLYLIDGKEALVSQIKEIFGLARTTEAITVPKKPTLTLKHLIGAKCVVTVHKGKAVLKLLNPTNSDILLKRREILAQVYNVNDTDILPFEPKELNQIEKQNATNQKNHQSKSKEKLSHDFDLEHSDLNESQKQKLLKLLKTYKHIFANDLSELGVTNAYFHRIETIPGASPVSLPFYRTSHKQQTEINKQVDEMEKNGIIEPSNSVWHSPVILVAKKNTSELRFAIDYRKLNLITIPMNFPLPRLENDPVAFVAPVTEEDIDEAVNDQEHLFQMQKALSRFKPILEYSNIDDLPDEDKMARKARRSKKLDENLKYTPSFVYLRFCNDVLRSCHDSLAGGGHLGRRYGHESRLKYWWPTIYADVETYVKTCNRCQMAKRNYNKFNPPLGTMPPVKRFERWQSDILGPLTKSPDGYSYVLLLIDALVTLKPSL